MAVLDHPRFGQLRYRANEEAWVGSIHLPRFAECHVVEEHAIALAGESENFSVKGLREKNRQAREERELESASREAKQCLPCGADWHG